VVLGDWDWRCALCGRRMASLEFKVKFITTFFAALAVAVIVAIVAVALFGPLAAWLIWGDHAAIGALCLSTSIAGLASLVTTGVKSGK